MNPYPYATTTYQSMINDQLVSLNTTMSNIEGYFHDVLILVFIVVLLCILIYFSPLLRKLFGTRF